MPDFDVLAGKTIKEILIDNEEQEFLIFITNDNLQFIFKADGDCCSESWFNDIFGVRYLLGHKVVKVEEIAVSSNLSLSFQGKRWTT